MATVSRLARIKAAMAVVSAMGGPPPMPTIDARKRRHNSSPYVGRDVPRNAPCPCGSGQKYKNCCMRLAAELAEAERRAEELQRLGVKFPQNHATA
jgi:hypothetical protein